jgi:hypothetical protein
MKLKIIISFCYLVFSFHAFAIVDYSENEKDYSPAGKNIKRVGRSSKSREAKPTSEGTSSFSQYSIHLSTGVDSLSVSDQYQQELKARRFGIQLGIETPYNLSLMTSYWQGKIVGSEREETSSEKGNPLFVVGLDLFEVGQESNLFKSSLYGGIEAAANSSHLAHSRDDKVVGLKISKKIYTMTFDLSGELRMTSTPSSPEETIIGNISVISGGLSWRAKPDITIALHASRYQIGASESSEENALASDAGLSTVTPSLLLSLGPWLDVKLGAHFLGDRPAADQTQELIGAKLYSLPGVYGTTLFGQLGISI